MVLIIGTISCGGKKGKSFNNLEKVNGNVYMGGTFNYNEVTNCRSLYPLDVTDVTSFRIVSQVYEGLVSFSLFNLTIEPCLAESWEIDSTNTIYTFHIREGVMFHDDSCFENNKGRELKADDVKYCFEKLFEASPYNQGYSFVENIIVGGNEYHESTVNGEPLSGGVSGVIALDDHTLQIHLTNSYPNILNILATPYCYIYPKEAVEKYGVDMRRACVGTGPFLIKDIKEDKAFILTKNKNYWGVDEHGNQLPYLDAIKVTFILEHKSEFLQFKKGNLDMVYRLPLEMMDEILDGRRELKEEYQKYQLQKTPGLNIQYYGFQHKSELFSNPFVRKAFNYAIDRRKIVDFTLKGTAIPAIYGVVPPALIGYNAKSIKGYTYDPDTAKQLLTEAGYPNGEGFPELTLQISMSGGRNIQVAEAIVKMLHENLNITVEIHKIPLAQHYQNVETGRALFWRSGWRGDYPDVETFLSIFVGKNVPKKLTDRTYLNPVRYVNNTFDSLYFRARQTIDEDERFNLFLQAEQTLMNDAAVMPIYTDREYRLLQPYVRNLHQNPLEYRNFRAVYFDPENENI